MSFIKRARLYVTRHKLKSLILLLVLVIVSTFMLTGIAIENALTGTATDVRASVGGRITLDIDKSPENFDLVSSDDNGNETWQYAADLITDEVLQGILEVPGVIDYNIQEQAFSAAAGVNFDFLPANFPIFDTPYGDQVFMHTTLNSQLFSGFANGNLRLESGRHLISDDKHAALISDELAEHNNLNVGDMLELYLDFLTPSLENMYIEVEIVGIFSGTRGTSGDALFVDEIASNQLILDLATAMMVIEETDPVPLLPGTLAIYVEDPISIQKVYDEIARLPEIEGKTFVLDMGTEAFDVIADPLESLQGLVYTLIMIISVVSMAILALLLTMWTRGRVKEIGILLSNGISKLEIISQFILEIVVIAVVAFALSFPISGGVADRAGTFIMNQFTDVQGLGAEETIPEVDDGLFDLSSLDGLSGSPTFENIVNRVDITVNVNDLVWVYVIGLPVTIGSVLIASYTVVKLKPKEILSKMS